MSQHIDPTPKQTDFNALNSKFATKTYTVTLLANDYVTPFKSYTSITISSDVANYGNVVSVIALNGGSSALPLTFKLNNDQSSLYVYGMGVNESVTVKITFMR